MNRKWPGPFTRWLPGVALVALGLGAAGCASRGIQPPAGVRPQVFRMEVTGYCECGACCGWKRNWYGRPVVASGPSRGQPKQVGLTASGTQARPGTVAADTRLLPFGTVVEVPGYGYGRVEDRGGAITGRRLDLFFRSHRQAEKWGRQQLPVRVWRVSP